MIENSNNRDFEICCDTCGETDCIEGTTFAEFWVEMKNRDWVLFHPAGKDFEHRCPTCSPLR